MFGMGLQEILVIFVIGVLIIGPDQLPKVARNLGKMFAQFKRATNDLRDAVGKEFDEHEELKEIQSFKSDLESEVGIFESTARNYLEKEVEREEQEMDKESKGKKGKTQARKKKTPQAKPGTEFPAQDEMMVSATTADDDTAVDDTAFDDTGGEVKPGKPVKKLPAKPRTPRKKKESA